MPPKSLVFAVDGVDHKECGHCKIAKPISGFNICKYSASGRRSQCKECMKKQRASRADYYKQWRKKPEVMEYYRHRAKLEKKLNPIRVWARAKAKTLERKSCIVCGNTKAEAHHSDYLKPLDVTWLCRTHHDEWHSLNGPGLNCDAPIPIFY